MIIIGSLLRVQNKRWSFQNWKYGNREIVLPENSNQVVVLNYANRKCFNFGSIFNGRIRDCEKGLRCDCKFDRIGI